MKRIVCLLTVFMLLFSVSVSAAGLDFLKEPYKSYEQSMEVSFTVNRPMDFLGKMLSGTGADNFVNAKQLAESLFKSVSKAEIKANISSDYKKIKVSMEGSQTVPAEVNRNLKLTVDSLSGIWVDLDLSNADAPKYSVIYKYPYFDKYLTADIFEMLAETEDGAAQAEQMKAMLNLLLSDVTVNGLQAANIKLLEECADVSVSGSTVTVKMDDTGAKKYIAGIAETLIDTINSISAVRGDNEFNYLPEASDSSAADMINGIKDAIESVRIFGKDGITIKCSLSGKYLGSAAVDAHISLNVGEIMRACGACEEDAAEYDSADVDFTVHIKETYKNVNTNVKVEEPTLTEENSVPMLDAFGIAQGEAEAEEYVDPNIYMYENEYIPAGTNGAYLGVRDIFENAYSDDFDIFYNNGEVSVVSANGKYGFNTVKFRVGNSTVNVDGMELALKAPIIEKNDKVYVDDFFVKAVFDYDLMSLYLDLTDGTVTADYYNTKW